MSHATGRWITTDYYPIGRTREQQARQGVCVVCLEGEATYCSWHQLWLCRAHWRLHRRLTHGGGANSANNAE